MIDENKPPETNEVLSRIRAEAARKSHEARKAKKLAEQIAKGEVPANPVEIAKKPATARDTAKQTVVEGGWNWARIRAEFCYFGGRRCAGCKFAKLANRSTSKCADG